MSNFKKTHDSTYLQLRQSSVDPTTFLNDRGDKVKIISHTQIIVNGNHHGSTKSAADAISKWSKK